ncbi:MAG TPA: ABC-F family ATP-binding cassette domain-containing protein [Longimicrobiales bacterium]|nr:ABC-F family ATP-binding cassette domain-containing protein [Longimicrobiales bacterium]
MISVSNLAKSYGDRVLFENVSLQLNPGERYGLVGANGAGKTTLLNILGGFEEASDGQVSLPRDLRLGVLRQDQFLYEDTSILGVALMGNPELWEAMVEKEELLAHAAAHPDDPFDADRFSRLEETVQRHDGYTAEARAATILEGLGLPTEIHRSPLSTLSGGFKLRVLLAQVLAADPDALLLDEPTNHLDILSIRWLEKFLAEFAGPVVVISHDHRFLDNVSTRILDVDYRTVTLYTGNYSDFTTQKREERERREKEIEAREKEISHHQEFVDRFRAKASKARQAQSKLRMIEKKAASLEALPGSSRRYPVFRFEPRRPSGREVLKAKGIRKAFGDKEVLHGVDLVVERGDRLAIMGPNGIGKSTLLKIVVGDLQADAGTSAWGYEAHVSYFAQDHQEALEDESGTVESWLWSFCPERDRGFVRGQLGLMLFSGDDGKKKVAALSGGEAARLVFARIALERPNVLVLDEPTNHLDLESIEALVEALSDYDGTLILVSHDRWFVRQLATRIVEITPAGITDYKGTYEEYVHASGDDHLDADAVVLRARREKRGRKRAEKESGGRGDGPSGGNGRSAQHEEREAQRRRKGLERERDELTESIDGREAELAGIDRTFLTPDYFERTPPEEVTALEQERARLQAEIKDLMERWEGVERSLQSLETYRAD